MYSAEILLNIFDEQYLLLRQVNLILFIQFLKYFYFSCDYRGCLNILLECIFYLKR